VGVAYEIRDRGTDREALVYNGLRYSIDVASHPRTSVGWVVDDERGVHDTCTVGDAAVVPGARDYVIERTRMAIAGAKVHAACFDYPEEPIRRLQRELQEVIAERRREDRAGSARDGGDAFSGPARIRTPALLAHSGHVTLRPRLGCYGVWVPATPGSHREIEIARVHDVAEGERAIAAHQREGRPAYVYARRRCPEAERGR
jgi:hypothetical protein